MYEKIADALERPRALWVLLGVCVFQCVLFVPMASLRLIDGDEGFYILAAKLVSQGKHLYTDFFYPQMPLLPYVYGLWMKLFGFSWYSARMLSALFAILTGVLIYRYVAKLSGKRALAVLAVLLYALCSLSLGWLTVAKTYALSTFLLLAAVVVLPRAGSADRPLKYVLSGLLLGLATDTRLFLVAAVPVFALAVWQREGRAKGRATRLGWWGLGIVLGLLPNLWFIAANAEDYWFNNVGYHSIRTGVGLIGGLGQKVHTVLELLGFQGGFGNVSSQFLILVLLNCGYLVLAWVGKKRLFLPFYLVIALSVVSLLPTPTFVQYFAVVVPFMAITSVVAMSWLIEVARQKRRQAAAGLLLTVALAVYVVVVPLDVQGYLVPQPDPLNPAASLDNWKIATVNDITSIIDANTTPGEAVMSWWPGYFVQSHSAIMPKMENHFGLGVARRLSAAQLDRYGIISEPEIRNCITNRTTRLVVLGNWVTEASKAQYRHLLGEAGYVLFSKVGDTEVYLCIR